jgi:hypothetical protein
MKKIHIGLIFSLIGSFIVIVFPFFITNLDLLNRYQAALSNIATLCSVITLCLALILFRKFGVQNYLINKNFDSVISLVEFLSSITLRFEIKKLPVSHKIINQGIFTFRAVEPQNYKMLSESLGEHELLFNDLEITFIGEEIGKLYRNDQFLPEDIRIHLKHLMPIALSSIDITNEITKKSLICAKKTDGVVRIITPKYNNFDEGITLQQFADSFTELNNAILLWIKKYSDKDISLKLPF